MNKQKKQIKKDNFRTGNWSMPKGTKDIIETYMNEQN
jgi:hypothetical protein